MRRKRRHLKGAVVLIFAGIYLFLMLLATGMVARKIYDENRESLALALNQVEQQIEQFEGGEGTVTDSTREGYYDYLMSVLLCANGDRYQQFSGAVYGADGRLIAESGNMFSEYLAGRANGRIRAEGFTDRDWEELADYAENFNYVNNELLSVEVPKVTGDRFYMAISDENTIERMAIAEVTLERQDENGEPQGKNDPLTRARTSHSLDGVIYVETGFKTIWEWQAPGLEKTDRSAQWEDFYQPVMPYLAYGVKMWSRWTGNEYLHGFADTYDTDVANPNSEYAQEAAELLHGGRNTGYIVRDGLRMAVYVTSARDGAVEMDTKPVAYIEIRSESRPWMEAADYLCEIYIFGLALIINCATLLLYWMGKLQEKQDMLEAARRDFTNAAAHELKTPLAIIRGLAENLKERTAEEKRDYYLGQIIRQTEQMDALVAEMIGLSKLDEGQIEGPKENLSMRELLKAQAEKLTPLIEEKKLHVFYTGEEDFMVTGSREQLEKAAFNLLSNAVLYNVPEGSIEIATGARMCRIENTAFPLSEEQLAHAFEMFYSGDESHGGHRGLGLYLTKRILDIYRLSIRIENTEKGVAVTIRK